MIQSGDVEPTKEEEQQREEKQEQSEGRAAEGETGF